MPNAWRVFTRDVGRIARVRQTWVILIGLCITPSLYAWFNIAAFWDPYGNTEHIKVAVVNHDQGAASEATGDIDVGGQVVAQLKENHRLGWQFLDENEAMTAVRDGSSYAAIVIPPDFSRDFVSITSGNVTRPTLQYYVNEKSNAVAPKITDVGASTLDTQVNSTFIAQVANTVTTELKKAGQTAESRLRDARSNTLNSLGDADDTVTSARGRITDLQNALTVAQSRLGATKDTLGKVDSTLAEVQSAVDQAQTIVAEAQQELLFVTDSVTNAYVSGATLLADASSKLNDSIAKLSAGVQQANAAVASAIDEARSAIATNSRQAIDQILPLLNQSGPGAEIGRRLNDAVTALQQSNPGAAQLLGQLQQLGADVTGATAAIAKTADAFNATVRDASASASAISGVLLRTVPDLNRAMSTLSTSAGTFSSALGAQRTQLTQAGNLLTGLEGQLGATSTALTALDGNFAGAQAGLDGVRSDVIALGSADVWGKLRTITGLNADQISQFLASPVEVHEQAVFPVEKYGSAMAPLFTNLALWIGAFVLVALLKLEVDPTGIERLTLRQAYVGRWLLLATIGVIQAIVVCVGDLVLGVQAVNALGFVATGVFIGLAYLSIIYALSVCFGYVGKGLCVLLVIMQIPGASGLYPIELMPKFFQDLYNFLPFSYGIDAMREMIGGFYDGRYWRALTVLAVFVAAAFGLGLFLRRRLGNFTLLFHRNIAATQLLVSEDAQLTGGHHRLSQIVDALWNHDEYRSSVTRRAEGFTRRYPMLLRLTLVVGVAVVVTLGLVGWLTPVGKATLLGLWVLWFLLVVGFLVTLEYTKQGIELATELGRMPESELRRAYASESAGGEAPRPMGERE